MIEDLSDAIAMLETGSYTVTRQAESTRVNGRVSQPAPTTLTIGASIQPAKSRELELLPEGYRGRGGQVCFTTTPLRTADGTGQLPDLVEVDGVLHEAVSIDGWESAANYQRVMLVRRAT